jgi:hypothetical protein
MAIRANRGYFTGRRRYRTFGRRRRIDHLYQQSIAAYPTILFRRHLPCHLSYLSARNYTLSEPSCVSPRCRNARPPIKRKKGLDCARHES